MKLLQNLIKWINGLWIKGDNQADKYVPIAVNVVQAVKKAIDSGNVDIIAGVVKNIIPGTVDDVIINKAVQIAKDRIPKLAIQLNIVKDILAIEGTPEQMQSALIALKNVFGPKWEMFCTGLAQEILVVISDGKVTWDEAWRLTKKYYDEYVKPKNK